MIYNRKRKNEEKSIKKTSFYDTVRIRIGSLNIYFAFIESHFKYTHFCPNEN